MICAEHEYINMGPLNDRVFTELNYLKIAICITTATATKIHNYSNFTGINTNLK